MATIRRVLNITRPSGTSNQAWLTNPANTTTIIRQITFANTDGSSASTYTLGYSPDGVTFSANSVIFNAVAIPSNTTHVYDCEIALINEDESLYIAPGGASDICFSAFGEQTLTTP